MIAFIQNLFIPSYFTVIWAFFGGVVYGFFWNKYGFWKTTGVLIALVAAYVAYKFGVFK